MNAEDMKDPNVLICPLMSCRISGGFIACRREKCAWWDAELYRKHGHPIPGCSICGTAWLTTQGG